MFPPGLEPGTFRVLGERDNHYTTETHVIRTVNFSWDWWVIVNIVHVIETLYLYNM